MSTRMRFTSENVIIISGVLTENSDRISLDRDGNLTVDQVITKLKGFNGQHLVSDVRLLDDTRLIDDEDSTESFLAWLFGIDIVDVDPDRISFRGNDVVTIDILDKDGNSLPDLISLIENNWEAGWWDASTGEPGGTTSHYKTVDSYKIYVEPDTMYTIKGYRIVVLEYKDNGEHIKSTDFKNLPSTFKTDADTSFLRFFTLEATNPLPSFEVFKTYGWSLKKSNIN